MPTMCVRLSHPTATDAATGPLLLAAVRTACRANQRLTIGSSAFIDAADPGNSASAVADDDEMEILSTFDDAIRSYALSWAIREASERSAKTARRVDKAAPKAKARN